MILFEEDWDKYPSAIIDTNTSNKSFVELAKLYRDMGVKNNAFHLALVNQDLKGVNPFDPDLDEYTLGKIAIECSINPWYYFRECARAPARSGLETFPLKANRGNIGLFWCFFNHITFFLIQPRQTGKSFSTDTLMTWLLEIGATNTEINLLTKDDILRRNNINRIKNLMDDIPRYLDSRNRKDTNNLEQITVNNKGNVYKTSVPQTSPKAAIKVGRGLTSAIFHCDEGPFCSNIQISLPAALASQNAAIDIAKKTDAPYGIIMTTTAGKKDEKEGAFIYNQLSNAAIMDEKKFFDCKNRVELEEVIRAASFADKNVYKNGVYAVNATFSHRQLGYTDEWLDEVKERTGLTGENALRDLYNVWTSGSSSSPLEVDQLQAIKENIIEDKKEELWIDGYSVRWYVSDPEDYLHTHKVAISFDTSTASGRDDIGMVITDVKSLKIVGAGTYNMTNTFTFGKFISNILIKYLNTMVIIEARSTGTTILDYIILALCAKGINPFTRLFNRVVQEKDNSSSNLENYKEVMRFGARESVANRFKNYFGYPTSGTGDYSREMLYGSCFRQAVKNINCDIKDSIISNEVLQLIIKNGRIDHPSDGHDDMVISWLLGNYWLTYGKGLDSYGLIPGEALSEIMIHQQKTMTPEEAVFAMEQQSIRNEMVSLYSELENEEDEYVSEKIEQQLRQLEKRLVLEDNVIFSLDQLIEEAKKKKKQRKSYNRSNSVY